MLVARGQRAILLTGCKQGAKASVLSELYCWVSRSRFEQVDREDATITGFRCSAAAYVCLLQWMPYTTSVWCGKRACWLGQGAAPPPSWLGPRAAAQSAGRVVQTLFRHNLQHRTNMNTFNAYAWGPQWWLGGGTSNAPYARFSKHVGYMLLFRLYH